MAARAVALAILLLPSLSWAEPPAEAKAQAKEFFERGNTAYRDGRYADALVSYRESYKLAPAASVLFNIGYCEELLSELEGAWLDYRRFLELAPSDHKRRTEIEKKVADLEARIEVKVSVSASLPGAAVFVDGAKEAVGRTPLTVKLRIGHHRLRIAAAHARAREVEVEAKVGVVGAVDVVLEPFGEVEVIADEGAEIRRRDLPGASWPGRVAVELPPGDYQFVVSKPGHLEQVVPVTIRGGEAIHQRVALSREPLRPGSLVVRSDGAAARVVLDARSIGQTPELRAEATPGLHDLAVERAGSSPWRGQLAIEPGRTTDVDVSLAPERTRLAVATAWAAAGLGAAALIAGGALGIVALEEQSNWSATPTRALGDQAQTLARSSDALLGVGVVAVAVSAVVYFAALRRTSHAAVRVMGR